MDFTVAILVDIYPMSWLARSPVFSNGAILDINPRLCSIFCTRPQIMLICKIRRIKRSLVGINVPKELTLALWGMSVCVAVLLSSIYCIRPIRQPPMLIAVDRGRLPLGRALG